jgi:phosphatidylglycerol lysyltransferase
VIRLGGAAVTRAPLRARSLVGLVPAIVLLLCSFAADEVAIAGRDRLGVWTLLPAGPVAGNWIAAELSSVALFLLAIALARGKRIGFWLALAAMLGAVVIQGLQLHHPIAATTAVVLALVLLATRGRYDVETSGRDGRLAAGLTLAAGATVALGTILTFHGAAMLRMVADAVAGVLDFATPVPIPGLATIGALFVVARVAYVVATMVLLDPAPDARPADEVASARRVLRRLGSGSLYPYQDGPMCLPIADATGRAVIAVARAGRTTVLLGDPAGDRAAGRRLFLGWAARARRRDLVPVVYQASSRFAADRQRAGWRTVRIGLEAIIDPTRFDLRAPRVANLRHTVTRARRGGLEATVSRDGLRGLSDPRLGSALCRLEDGWRRRTRPALGFTVGTFDPADTSSSLIAVAVDAAGDAAAFAVFRPTGADGGWALDVMRRAPDSIPGAMELALLTAIEALSRDGVRRVSLGLAPLAGLEVDRGPVVERALGVAVRCIRPLYDVRGLAFYKGKFDPTWEERYLVVRRWWHLPAAIIGLVRLHLGGSWPNVIRSFTRAARPT